MTRANHLEEILASAEQEYLREPLGPQLQLSLLATHPEWDGNGFAAAEKRLRSWTAGWKGRSTGCQSL